MLAAERRDFLLTRLRADGSLVAKDLAAELGISEDSIRRDLRDLAAAGLCQRVYGGAVPASPALADYGTRASVEPDSKRRVAARAAALITPGSTLILDGGTTTLAVVHALPADLDCTVITHSPTIAAALVSHERAEVFLLGGRLFKHSAVTCGAAAAEAASSVAADLFFLGVTGVHPVHGLTTGDADEAAMKRTLAGRAVETYVLASAEKLGAASRYRVLPLSAVAGVIIDGSPADTVAALADEGVTILSSTTELKHAWLGPSKVQSRVTQPGAVSTGGAGRAGVFLGEGDLYVPLYKAVGVLRGASAAPGPAALARVHRVRAADFFAR